MESKEKSEAYVFYKKEHRLNISQFEKEFNRLMDNKISFADVNIKLHRKGSIFNYEKLKKEYSDIEFAPVFDDDLDENFSTQESSNENKEVIEYQIIISCLG